MFAESNDLKKAKLEAPFCMILNFIFLVNHVFPIYIGINLWQIWERGFAADGLEALLWNIVPSG